MEKCCIGVPKEVKEGEGRVALTPRWVEHLVDTLDAQIVVEEGAGLGSGWEDQEYVRAGATIAKREMVWSSADLILKVKEPTASEYPMLALAQGKTLFTYLHLAGSPVFLTEALLTHRITAIAYEGVRTESHVGRPRYPLLAPMSRIAGEEAMRAALKAQSEAHEKVTVVVIGGGTVGESATRLAISAGVGDMVIFEAYEPRVHELKALFAHRSQRVAVLPMSDLNEKVGKQVLAHTDIVICAPMLPGGVSAPIVLNHQHFRIMPQGAYVVDVAIDQGGSTSWTRGRPTKPGEVFVRGKKGIRFSATPNIPGSAVPYEATEALTEATIPYIEHIVCAFQETGDVRQALREDASLRFGLQTFDGALTSRTLFHHFTKAGKTFSLVDCLLF